MELNEFNDYIRDEIASLANQESITNRESFYNFYTKLLMDAQEFDEFQYLTFEGIGRSSRRIQIDGYSYDELDDVLILFIAPILNNFNLDTIVKTDADRLFKRALYFYQDADIIIKTGEESSAGYGFAHDCLGLYKNVKKIRVYLLTDQVMSKQIKSIENEKIDDIEVEYHLWDVERIHKLFESGENKEEIEIDLHEFDNNGIPCLIASKTEDYESYLCNIPGILLANLYNKYGGRLLEGNVRFFLQTKGKVNKGIRNTILNNPNMFFAYNNGITTTASDVKIENNNGQYFITYIKGLQIVNGGQTTASLANSLFNDKRDNSEEKIRKIFVPMKLSKISLNKAQEIIPSISRYANSQNKVSDSDLWSNHPYHIRIEEYSRRITAPATNGNQYGTKWYYERANGQYLQETYKSTPAERNRFLMLNPKQQMFKKTDLSKFVNIHEMQPNIASAGGQKSFVKFAESISKQWEKDNSEFNEEYYKRLISIIIMIKETDRIVKEQTWFKGSYKANIVAYTISRLVYEIQNKYSDKVLPYKGVWLKQKVSNAFTLAIKEISEKMYNHLVDEKRQRENVTEWAKLVECWNIAKEIKVNLPESFINELEYKSDLMELKKDGRKDAKQEVLINAMVEVVNYGVDGWKDLARWGLERKYFTPTDMDFISAAIAMEKGKIPSDKQCQRIMQILNKAREDSFPGIVRGYMLRVVETFSGIGSQAKALKKANIQHEILATIEWDINAILAYDLIHNGPQDFSSYKELSKKELIEELSKYAISNDGKNPIKPRSLSIMSRDSLISILIAIKRTKNLINITEVHGNDLPDGIDVLTYSFPCQDLSICGLWHGNVSGIKKGIKNRSGMLWEIERILYELRTERKALPKFLLMENVSNILSKRHIDDFNQWLNYLEEIGYHNKVYTLNSLNFGVPQNRKRTFMISVFKDDVLNKDYLEKYFKDNNLENIKMNLNSLEDYLRLDYRKKKYKNEAIESNPNKTPSRVKIFEENLLIFDGKNVITEYANTITTKQDRNPNSGVIKFNYSDKKSDYRNLTPRECFLLMGFDEQDFQMLIDNNVFVKSNYAFFTMQKLIKLAGNSIVVDILESIFMQINELKNISLANYMEE